MNQKQRESLIIKTSITGILTNLLLALFKAIVGLMVHSIAITLDALNNFSDVLSSIVTIIGTKLANKKADAQHPFGHGRYEFLAPILIALLILYAGTAALWESIKKILHPVTPNYGWISIVLMVVALFTKITLGQYVKKKGELVKSNSLIASGKDALFDAILTGSVLVSILLYMLFNISMEAYVGLVISFFILKAGYELITEMVSELLGSSVDIQITSRIQEIVESDCDVLGAFDLLVHNYGPNTFIGSIHVEVDENMSARDIDIMTRRILESVYSQTGIHLSAIGIYAKNNTDPQVRQMQKSIESLILPMEDVLQIHGLYIDIEKKEVVFDVVIGFDVESEELLHQEIEKKVSEIYPEYSFRIILEHDISQLNS